ncbi:MAG: arginase family protein [Mariniphaga sp.]|nr:arginase family protein [Mariniphaga sp.]
MIKKTSEKFSGSQLKKPDVVILGVPYSNGEYFKDEYAIPNKIRSSLYSLGLIEKKLNISDLGNLKPATTHKGTFLALRDVIEYLREADIITVVIGGSQELTIGICEAFTNDRFFWLTAVDARLDIKKGVEKTNSTNYLSQVFKNHPHLFQFSLVGYQNHLVGEVLMDKVAGFGEHIRLGQLRENFQKAELIMRSTSFITFDMGAIRNSDAPGTCQNNPNGLFGEDACLLARYAGLSQNLSVFGLFGAIREHQTDGQTPRLAAEIIWYFLEGVSQRKPSGKRILYKVEIDGLEQALVFLHDQETNRWWFEVKSLKGECIEIACSEEEYRLAASDEIPGRWLKFVQKLDHLLK